MSKYFENRRQRRDEKGFTLIELMVVVLIMGILMAIAIPTFLSTRGSANDAAAKSNASNVLLNEKSYFADNNVFLAATTSTAGNQLDPTLPWGTAAGEVAAYAGNSNDSVLVVANSSSGNCFYAADEESSSGSASIGYAEVTNAGGTCPAPTATAPWAGTGDTFNGPGTAPIATAVSGGVPTIFYASY